MRVHRVLSQILIACALGAGATACGSSGTSSTSSSSASATASQAATASAGGSAAQQITTNWAAFFNAKTPVAKRISLLQDGQTFASIIQSQAGGGLAAQATAKVTKVTLVSSSQAKVIYSILIGGQSALANQSGTAVLENGTWKVGVASFCGLLALENGGSTVSLPAACKATG